MYPYLTFYIHLYIGRYLSISIYKKKIGVSIYANLLIISLLFIPLRHKKPLLVAMQRHV